MTSPAGLGGLRLRHWRLAQRALAAVILGLCLAGTEARAAELPAECQAALDARLAEAGIRRADVVESSVARRSGGGEARTFLGYSAWLKLQRCRGRVVVDLDPQCIVEQAYSRGDCRIGGLRNW